MQVNVRINFVAVYVVFFIISGESEHSDSKLYYLGKVSYAQLLQLPTHSECTKAKSTLFTNVEVFNFNKMPID